MKLCKSYRSTYEITEFAQRIAKNEELEAIERNGEEPAVALLPTEKKEIEWIENLITSCLLYTSVDRLYRTSDSA